MLHTARGAGMSISGILAMITNEMVVFSGQTHSLWSIYARCFLIGHFHKNKLKFFKRYINAIFSVHKNVFQELTLSF